MYHIFRISIKYELIFNRKFVNMYNNTRQVSSMIHSARPMVPPVVNIVFFSFTRFVKWPRTDGRTDVRTDDMCKNNDHYLVDQ